jgi:hypothetical protein
VQGALEWLEKTQDKPLEELQNEGKDDVDEEETEAAIKGLEAGDSAKSLVCNECGKKFRNQAMATFHAEKRYAVTCLSSHPAPQNLCVSSKSANHVAVAIRTSLNPLKRLLP